MRGIMSFVLASFLMTAGTAAFAAPAAPAKTVPARQAIGKIATWTKLDFSVQPTAGKPLTFLIDKTTKITGKPAVGKSVTVQYTSDKAGKMLARSVVVK